LQANVAPNTNPYPIPLPTTLVALNKGGGLPDPRAPTVKLYYIYADLLKASSLGSLTSTSGQVITGGGGFDGSENAWAWGPSSQHPGGANHVMADGSVQFINDSVNPQTYFGLATRAGKEPVSGEGGLGL
jgi:prepilin-type processing-associated H-X9-DG protein